MATSAAEFVPDSLDWEAVPQDLVARDRGKVFERPGFPPPAVTVHPAAILRERDETSRVLAMRSPLSDLAGLALLLQVR